MVDTVSSDVLFSGNNRYIVRLYGVSDGTGETDVVKIDKSALAGPDRGNAPSKIKIESIQYDIQGHAKVTLEWDGTTDTPILVMAGQGFKDFELDNIGGGLVSDNADGTGDVLLTSSATAGASYDITINCRLKG